MGTHHVWKREKKVAEAFGGKENPCTDMEKILNNILKNTTEGCGFALTGSGKGQVSTSSVHSNDTRAQRPFWLP
jgi:hypothetical protein